MIPVLYKSTETAFTTNGLGRLSGCVRCTVHEVLNGIYELAMTYPIGGKLFDDLQEGRLIFAIHDDTKLPQPFEIYRISRPLNGKVLVNAWHWSYKLRKIVCKPFTAAGVQTALTKLASEAMTPCAFTFTSDKTTTGNMSVTVPTAIRSLMGGQQGSIIDVYGGEWEYNMRQCILRNRRGTDTGVNIRYGKNLSDLNRTTDMTNIWSGVVPYWNGTAEDGSEQSTYYDGVVWSAARDTFHEDMVVSADCSGDFDTMPTQAQMQTWGQSYISANARAAIPATTKVSFVQLWQTEEYKDVAPLQRLSIGDSVRVYYEKLGVDDTARIVEYTYDVLTERYESMTLGEVRASFPAAVKNDIEDAVKDLPTKSFFEQALDAATEMITGGLGGYVVLNRNDAGEPEEILVMNTPDKTTATQVMRINKNGIGFGTSYNGPFNSAWTINGTFDAQQINVINLNAASIVTGILKDASGSSYFNLSTGEIHMLKGLVQLQGTIRVNTGSAYENRTGRVQVSAGGLDFDILSGTTWYPSGNIYPQGQGSMRIWSNLLELNGDMGGWIIGDMTKIPNANTRNNWYGFADDFGFDGIYGGALPTNGIFQPSGNPVILADRFGARQIHCSSLRYKDGAWLVYSNNNTAQVYCYADFRVSSGYTKSKVEDTDDFGTRALYSYEMPSPIYGDMGTGETDDSGECYVALDPIFEETIERGVEYCVFLQSEADGKLWIDEKRPEYFVVKGDPGIRFSWEVKAVQAGLAGIRLEEDDHTEIESSSDITRKTALVHAGALDDFINEQEEILNEDFIELYGA